MAQTRQTMTPVSMNQFAFSGATPIGAVAPTTGCDYAGVNTSFTAWSALPVVNSSGIQYVNNGSQFLWFYCGAATTTAYVLIGQKAGGQVEPYTTYSIVLAATSYGFLGPFSPSQYNQQDASQFVSGTGNGGAAPGGVIGTGGIGMTCIDFLNTTNIAVRLYQMGTVNP